MDIFGDAFGDAIIYDTPAGDFRLSDYHLTLSSFSTDDTYELGMSNSVNEEYLSYHAVPVFLGTKYDSSSKLKGTMTIVKTACSGQQTVENANLYMTQNECRTVLRALTGWHGYKRMYFYFASGVRKESYYKIHVNSASMIKMNGKTIGLTLEFECDSPYVWMDRTVSHEFTDQNGGSFMFEIISDANEYILPQTSISIDNTYLDEVTLEVEEDENRITMFYGMLGSVSLNSVTNRVYSALDHDIVNHFNCKFPRLLPGYNTITVNKPMTVTFYYASPRKVGWS